MKPKTASQILTVQLSSELKDLNRNVIEWCKTKFDTMAAMLKRNIVCLDCNHTFDNKPVLLYKIDKSGICPNCGKKFKIIERGWSYNEVIYVAVMEVIKDRQVVRMFYCTKHSKKGYEPEYSFMEVMQHFVDSKGNINSMSMPVQGLSRYYDQWIRGAELEIRNSAWQSTNRADITPCFTYPKKKILPVIKRNGYRGKTFDITPHKFFSFIIKDRHAETLLKAGQYKLLASYYRYRRIDRYWDSIKICIRNGYIIKNPSTWEDHIKLLEEFGKDIRSPKYVCPENLYKDHQKLIEKRNAINARKKREELLEAMLKDDIAYKEQKAKFLDLLFKEGDFEIKPLRSVMEFYDEGTTLHHCVFSNEYFKKPESLILSARKGEKPIETIEVSLNDFNVVQSRGKFNNPTPYHNQILEVVNKNMHKIQRKALEKAI